MTRKPEIHPALTPDAFLREHLLTKKLRDLGVTDKQLELGASTLGFDSRGFFVPGWPQTAQRYARPYNLLCWLVLEDPRPSDATRAAWETIADALARDYMLAERNVLAARAPRPRRSAESTAIRALLQKDRSLSEKDIRRELEKNQIEYRSEGFKDRVSRIRKTFFSR